MSEALKAESRESLHEPGRLLSMPLVAKIQQIQCADVNRKECQESLPKIQFMLHEMKDEDESILEGRNAGRKND